MTHRLDIMSSRWVMTTYEESFFIGRDGDDN